MSVDNIEVESDFWSLKGFDNAQIEVRPATVAITSVQENITVPAVKGVPVGSLVTQTRRVKMIQLVLADRADLLYPNFPYDNPENDINFDAYWKSIENRGAHIEPLHVLSVQGVVNFGGDELPVFAVYDDPIQFTAMLHIGHAEADIIIETQLHPRDLLLQALSRTQHTHTPSLIDLCDVAKRLSEYGYSQEDIALHMLQDSPNSFRLDRTAISRMIAMTDLPDGVRAEMNKPNGLKRSHAELLIVGRIMSNPTAQTQLAKWVVDQRKTVRDLENAINLCFPKTGEPSGHIEVYENGSIEIIDDNQAISLANEQRIKTVTYPTMTTTAAFEIQRAQQIHKVLLAVDNGEVYAEPSSLAQMRKWIQEVSKSDKVPLHDIEVITYGFLYALHEAAKEQNLLARDGTIAPVKPKVTIVEQDE